MSEDIVKRLRQFEMQVTHQAADEIERLRAALRMVVLFYQGSVWTVKDQSEWEATIGQHSVTTRTLSAYINGVLGND